MDSGFPQPDIDLTPNLLIGAALLAPGFSDDLSTWRMTMASDGSVVQELHPTCVTLFYDAACMHLRLWIDQHRIGQIRSLAEEIGFGGFDDEYQAGCDYLEHTSVFARHVTNGCLPGGMRDQDVSWVMGAVRVKRDVRLMRGSLSGNGRSKLVS
jgi:hypothetical protein